jgi:hypothetical protein
MTAQRIVRGSKKMYKHGEKKEHILNDRLFHLRKKPLKTFEKCG